ncbi:MAG: hypothetical protein ACE5RP_00015 [Nitrosopumilus sp.]
MVTNYSVEPDLFDLDAEINDSLSMAKNWTRLKPKVLLLCRKRHKVLFE